VGKPRGASDRDLCSSISENKPVDTVFKHDLMEVDQETQRFVQEFNVAEQLSFVDRKDCLDRLELNDSDNRQSGRLDEVVPRKRTLCIRSEQSIRIVWGYCATRIPCARICGR
jgi:hypothetical protein